MSTHTPTPWQIAGVSTERLVGRQRGVEADFIHIEAVGYEAGGGIGLVHDKPHGVGLANTQLIIRAVNSHAQLLEALEGTMKVLRNLRDHCQPEWDAIVTGELLNAWDANKAAIAAAKGD